MDKLIYFFLLLINFLRCDGATLNEQLEHILRRRLESSGYHSRRSPTRRNIFADAANVGTIIGVPSVPSHLPEAEAILPGHTLIRPALGMLKSSIKFPLRELENGAGVYGNINNIGLRWDGKNERLLNTGFRRNMDDYYRYEDDENYRRSPSEYIMVVPTKKQLSKPSFSISNMILDLDEKRNTENKILERLKKLRQPIKNTNKLLLYVAEPDSTPTLWKRLLANNDPNLFKQFKEEEEENEYNPQTRKNLKSYVRRFLSEDLISYISKHLEVEMQNDEKWEQIINKMESSPSFIQRGENENSNPIFEKDTIKPKINLLAESPTETTKYPEVKEKETQTEWHRDRKEVTTEKYSDEIYKPTDRSYRATVPIYLQEGDSENFQGKWHHRKSIANDFMRNTKKTVSADDNSATKNIKRLDEYNASYEANESNNFTKKPKKSKFEALMESKVGFV